LALVIDYHLHRHILLLLSSSSFSFSLSSELSMSTGNSRQDGIKVFQIEDLMTFVVLIRIIHLFGFKNIVASTSPSLFSVYYRFQLAIS
jgi:hypothetical protein